MSGKAAKEQKKFETDVLVVGGGTAGFVAAISAARNGAKVLLLEQRDHLAQLPLIRRREQQPQARILSEISPIQAQVSGGKYKV